MAPYGLSFTADGQNLLVADYGDNDRVGLFTIHVGAVWKRVSGHCCLLTLLLDAAEVVHALER